MPLAIAAVGAVGAIGSAVVQGSAAKSAAKTQANAAAQQQAALNQTRDQNVAMFQPDVNAGNVASTRINDLLGLSGNKVDAQAVLASTPGYQYSVQEGLKGVNSNAYALGNANSGATLKALQSRGQNLADQNFNNYVGQVTDVANRGTSAKGAIAGITTNTTNSSNGITQNLADTKSNLAIFNANNVNNALGSLAKFGGTAFESSYGGGGHSVGGQPISNSLYNMLKKGNGF